MLQSDVGNHPVITNGRMPDGTFAPGNQLTPGRLIYRYADRAARLQEEMTTEEILALDADDKALGKRPAIDTIVIRRLARALTKVKAENCSDVERSAEAHLDRMEGKAIQSQQSLIAIADMNKPLPENDRKALEHYFKIKGINNDESN